MSLSPPPNTLISTATTAPQPPPSPIILDSPRTPVNELNLNKFLVLSKSNSSLSNSFSSQSSQAQSSAIVNDVDSNPNSNEDEEKSIAALKETLSALLTRESTPSSTNAHPHFESTFSFRSNFYHFHTCEHFKLIESFLF